LEGHTWGPGGCGRRLRAGQVQVPRWEVVGGQAQIVAETEGDRVGACRRPAQEPLQDRHVRAGIRQVGGSRGAINAGHASQDSATVHTVSAAHRSRRRCSGTDRPGRGHYWHCVQRGHPSVPLLSSASSHGPEALAAGSTACPPWSCCCSRRVRRRRSSSRRRRAG
jgi:hypothetical protein